MRCRAMIGQLNDLIGNKPCPTGLVRCTQATTIVTVEELERMMVEHRVDSIELCTHLVEQY